MCFSCVHTARTCKLLVWASWIVCLHIECNHLNTRTSLSANVHNGESGGLLQAGGAELLIQVERKLFVSVPEQEESDLSPITRFLEQRREGLEVEQILNRLKEEFSMKIEGVTRRGDDLKIRRNSLLEAVNRFDRNIKADEAKLVRNAKAIKENKKTDVSRDHELTDLRAELSDLLLQQKRQSRSLAAHLNYQTYLESLVDNSQFIEIKDILTRYDTLAASNAELLSRSTASQDSIEKCKQELSESSEVL